MFYKMTMSISLWEGMHNCIENNRKKYAIIKPWHCSPIYWVPPIPTYHSFLKKKNTKNKPTTNCSLLTQVPNLDFIR